MTNETGAMTAPTLEQMRVLADRNDAEAEAWRQFSKTSGRIALHEESAAALRAAADQLEAVQELHQWLRKNIGSPALHARLDRFAADTAPQEASALDAKLDALGLRDPDEPARPDSLPFPHAKADKMLAPQENRDA